MKVYVLKYKDEIVEVETSEFDIVNSYTYNEGIKNDTTKDHLKVIPMELIEIA